VSEDSFGFVPPTFQPEAALIGLRRSLRDLGLAERGAGFELRGKQVLELAAEESVVRARIARRLMITPEWDAMTLAGPADVRKLVDEVKKRLARWERED
jgi:hypothetical protein